ncbi:unnamed protein product [Parascedosporium putredinis]|uniref:Uncharacterized protein n=1 Tax=Parascedosporium putredinis TaxID=1442378 RepID=A0A9P1H8I5_9PEZI|nr:unnamed protein product [Parascedosporium putredinis]CAI7999821.1 unnamed protein product [Parascedosporium putredinis]
MRGLLALLLLHVVGVTSAVAEYHEQLNLRPLPLSSLLASFNFRATTPVSDFESQNFRLFPRSLGQILQHAGTRELHLRFALGRTRTTRPVMSFQPEGTLPNATISNMRLLHGVLPHEVVCTENLTPFLKLLPCKGKAGISSLLDGHKLFDASWQSMAIDVRPVCPEDGSECVLEIEQTVDMVLDIDRSKRPRDNPIPRPKPLHELKCDTTKPYHADGGCYPLDHALGQEWTLSQIFGKSLKGTCPLTNPETPGVHGSAQLPPRVHLCRRCGNEEPRRQLAAIGWIRMLTLISFMGYGQERGAVQTILRNPSPDTEVEFVYMESLPWFMRVYLHTLDARIDGIQGSRRDLVKEIYYRPAVDRARGTQLELRMIVPRAPPSS